MQRISKDLVHYLPLFGILTISAIGIVNFSYDPEFQRAIAVSTAASYVAWGTVHHIIHKDLNLGVFLEYIGISFIGLIMILSVIP